MRRLSILLACAALAWQVSATAQGAIPTSSGRPASARSSASTTPPPPAPMPGRACRSPSRRSASCAGRRRSIPTPWKAPRAHAAVRQRLRAVRAASTAPAPNNHYDATIGTTLEPDGRQRGLPLPEHLAPGRPARRPAGDRVRARRQQRLRLHRRPGVRRRHARRSRQRRRRVGELPARHLRLPQPAAAEDRRPTAGRLGQLRAARHHQGAAVRPATTSPTSAATRATSR